jgi:hypothetical protein
MRNVLNYVHLVHVIEECLGCEGLPSFLGFALAFLVNIYKGNILKLFERYDTNGLDLKEFMDETRSNMI